MRTLALASALAFTTAFASPTPAPVPQDVHAYSLPGDQHEAIYVPIPMPECARVTVSDSLITINLDACS